MNLLGCDFRRHAARDEELIDRLRRQHGSDDELVEDVAQKRHHAEKDLWPDWEETALPDRWQEEWDGRWVEEEPL